MKYIESVDCDYDTMFLSVSDDFFYKHEKEFKEMFDDKSNPNKLITRPLEGYEIFDGEELMHCWLCEKNDKS